MRARQSGNDSWEQSVDNKSLPRCGRLTTVIVVGDSPCLTYTSAVYRTKEHAVESGRFVTNLMLWGSTSISKDKTCSALMAVGVSSEHGTIRILLNLAHLSEFIATKVLKWAVFMKRNIQTRTQVNSTYWKEKFKVLKCIRSSLCPYHALFCCVLFALSND